MAIFFINFPPMEPQPVMLDSTKVSDKPHVLSVDNYGSTGRVTASGIPRRRQRRQPFSPSAGPGAAEFIAKFLLQSVKVLQMRHGRKLGYCMLAAPPDRAPLRCLLKGSRACPSHFAHQLFPTADGD
jgi:hypothetical protein